MTILFTIWATGAFLYFWAAWFRGKKEDDPFGIPAIAVVMALWPIVLAGATIDKLRGKHGSASS